MSFITEILNSIKKCCCPFLTHPDQLDSVDDLSQPLIEMQPIPKDDNDVSNCRKRSKSRPASCIQRKQVSQQMQDVQNIKDDSYKMIHSSGPRKTKGQNNQIQRGISQVQESCQLKPFKMTRVQSGKIRSSQRKSGSESSFQTIKSTASRAMSRRNFTLLRKSSNFFAKHRSAQQDFQSVNQSQNSSINQHHMHKIINLKFSQFQSNRDGIDLMNTWIKKQYQQFPNRLYKPCLSQITKMKLQRKDQLDNMVHKLEDYYTFYYQDRRLVRGSGLRCSGQQEKLSHCYQESNHQMLCSFTMTDYTKSFDYEKNCKFMSLIILPCCSLQPLMFLQWFNQQEVQSFLHSFGKIWFIQNSERINDKLTLEYPLVRVQQFNDKLDGKQNYLLARQIEVVKFENQEDKQTLLEICFQVVDEQKCFERLIRVTAQGDGACRVEIYIQSSENITKKRNNPMIASKLKDQKGPQFQYFQERWKEFEQKLNKDYIINKKSVQVFQN